MRLDRPREMIAETALFLKEINSAPCIYHQLQGRVTFLKKFSRVAAIVLLTLQLSTPGILAQQLGSEEKPAKPSVSQPLAGIRIEGNISIPSTAIEARIKSHPNRATNPQQVREDVNALYNTGWFFAVEPIYRMTDDGPVLIFKVTERPIIRSVEYRGNKKIKQKHLAAHTGLKPGGAFNINSNKESARRLENFYHEKGFAFATVELLKGGSRNDREIIFLINEGPKVRVTKISFDGNDFFSGPVLKTRLRSKTAILWKIGGLYDPTTIPDDILALKEYYHSLGFFDVQIKDDVTFSKSRASAHIKYMIEEGTRYKLRNVEYHGNKIFSDAVLSEKTELHSGDYFNVRKMNKDVSNIKERYGKLGHLFATVDSIPRFLETPGEADLVLQINEDKPYRIRKFDVNIRGDHPHTRINVPRNMSTIVPGDLADPKMLELTKSRLSGGIFEQSGPQAPQVNIKRVGEEQLARRNVFRGQNAEVSDPFRSSRSNQQRASSVRRSASQSNVNNANYTDSVDEIQPFRNANGSDAVPQPYSTIQQQGFTDGIANPANPIFGNSPQGDPFGDRLQEEPPNWVDVTVDVTEARTGRLMFGVGVNSDAGVVGSIVLDERNFDIMRPPRSFQDILDGTAWRGGGQRFRIEAIPGNEVSRYLVSWTDPYFLDTNYSLGLSGFYYTRFFEDWDEQRLGGRISVGRQYSPFFSVSTALRLENVEIRNPATPTPLILRKSLGDNFLSTGRISATYDRRDSSFLPSEGYIVEGGYEQAFGDFNYPRFDGSAKNYWTVWSRPDGRGKHIVSLGGQMGWTGKNTPVFENFFAGGFSTFRGFDFRGVGPTASGARVGGRFMMLGTAEYMFPIMANEMLHGVVFSDFGTVEKDSKIEDFRVTVGAGFRITVPAMGPVPLSFDWAVPLAKKDSDDERLFSFYIGVTR